MSAIDSQPPSVTGSQHAVDEVDRVLPPADHWVYSMFWSCTQARLPFLS
jgi:hypothetical protein